MLKRPNICYIFEKLRVQGYQISLQLALDSARFEFTLKMRLNRIWPKDPTYAIFLKSWVFKDVKYDIPMCQYHSTRPQPIQLVPTMQKKLFTSSFQVKFLKIRFTKFAGRSSFLVCLQIFFFPSVNQSQGHIWAKMWHYVAPLTPKKMTAYEPKMAKNALWKIAEPPTQNRKIIAVYFLQFIT